MKNKQLIFISSKCTNSYN